MSAPLVPPVYAHDPMPLVQRVLATPALDPIMEGVSRLCEGWVLALLALSVAVLLERRSPWRWAVAVGLGVAFVADGAVVWGLKHALDLPRPVAVLGPDQVRVLLEPSSPQSMPSGHASAAATLAAWGAGRSRRAGAALGVLALLAGLSRVYVGAHWALDVVAGWAIGAAVGAAGARITARVAARASGRSAGAAAPAGAAA
jgi:membrane-associated phospholipid phosphatase